MVRLKKHWIIVFALLGIALVAVAAFVFAKQSGEIEAGPGIQIISPSEARAKMNERQDAFVLDVRSPEEFYVRRIPGAINIHYQRIVLEQNRLPQNKNMPILVYCNTYVRSASAAVDLLEMGYTNIFIFPGMRFWEYETVSG